MILFKDEMIFDRFSNEQELSYLISHSTPSPSEAPTRRSSDPHQGVGKLSIHDIQQDSTPNQAPI